MTGERIRSGGCLCGSIRYQVSSEPYVSGLCHCATCRKLTGSFFSATANWRLDQFSYTGELETFERRQFCPRCGSRLFFMADDGVEVFLGTLDDAPGEIEPLLEIWTCRREAFLPPFASADQHRQNPPS